MSIIEQIKAEIERLYGKYETKYHETRLPYVEGLLDGFDLVEQFLSTLESEKPVQNDLAEEQYNLLNKACDARYEQAERAFIALVKQYLVKGERCMNQSIGDGEGDLYTFWDGFHNCAENILRELEE